MIDNTIEPKRDFLNRIVFGWMKPDVEQMKERGLNFPLALCVLSYMEFLGTILLGKNTKNYKTNVEKYINECFDRNKDEYPIEVLLNFRHALAHEYFARGAISKDGRRPIVRKGDNQEIILDINQLACDFIDSLDKFKVRLEQDKMGNFEARINAMQNDLESLKRIFAHNLPLDPMLVLGNTNASVSVAAIYDPTKLKGPGVVSAANIGLWLSSNNKNEEKNKKMNNQNNIKQ